MAHLETVAAGGGGTVDPVARATASANQAKIDSIQPSSGASVAKNAVIWLNQSLWENKTAAAITVPVAITDANLTTAGLTKFLGSVQVDEVVLSTADLTGAAPAGAKYGRNTTTGRDFYVDAGNWVATTAPTSANTITGTGAPLNSRGLNGEFYRQVDAAVGAFRIWGPKAGGVWPAAATLEVAPDPGNAQWYILTRTNTSPAVPTAGEVATPRDGDVADVRLADATRLLFKYVGTAWALQRTDAVPADVGSFRGGYVPASALPAGAGLRPGDFYRVDVAGAADQPFTGRTLQPGDEVVARITTPGVAADWYVRPAAMMITRGTAAQLTAGTDTAGQTWGADVLATLRTAGRIVGSGANWGALPTTSTETGAARDGDLAYSLADQVGTGSADAPQYPRGWYRRAAGAWALWFAAPRVGTAGLLSTGTDTENRLWAALELSLGIQSEIRRSALSNWLNTFNGYGRQDLGGQAGSIRYATRNGLVYQALVAAVPVNTDPATDTVNWAPVPPVLTALTAAQAQDGTDTTVGAVTGQRLRGVTDTHVRGLYLGQALTFATLPILNAGRVQALNGDWAVLSADDIGNGTANSPQYPRGIYVTNGTTFTLSSRFNPAGNVTGVYMGSSATFTGLPTSNPTKAATNGDWAALSADVIGTGTALNPQYPRGVYVYNGTAYSFAFALTSTAANLTQAQAESRTDTTMGAVSGQRIAQAIEAEVRGLYMGSAANYVSLPIGNTQRATPLAGDWALLTMDDIGTGTADTPQYERGIYRHNGTIYAFVNRLAESQVINHTGTPALPGKRSVGAIAVNSSTGRISHRWNVGTQAWVALTVDAGVLLGSAATFVALPTTGPNGRVGQADDFAILTAATIGTGTAASPQYPRGIYRYSGASFALMLELPPAAVQTGGYMGAAVTYATLPTTNGVRAVGAGDWAVLTADVTGTGSVAAPQYPRGIYTFNGTYQFSTGLSSNPIVYHTGTPATPPNPSQNAIAVNTAANIVTHRWDPAGAGAWVALVAPAIGPITSGVRYLVGAKATQTIGAATVELRNTFEHTSTGWDATSVNYWVMAGVQSIWQDFIPNVFYPQGFQIQRGGVLYARGGPGREAAWNANFWNPLDMVPAYFGAQTLDAGIVVASVATQSYANAQRLALGGDRDAQGITEANSILTVAEAGVYMIRVDGSAIDNGGAATRFMFYLGRDGNEIARRRYQVPASGEFGFALSAIQVLNANNTLDVRACGAGGEACTINGMSIQVQRIR